MKVKFIILFTNLSYIVRLGWICISKWMLKWDNSAYLQIDQNLDQAVFSDCLQHSKVNYSEPIQSLNHFLQFKISL